MGIDTQFSLENKVIIVTGGAGLLGQQHILAIAGAGGRAIMLDVDQEAIENAKKSLFEISGQKISSYVVDITREESVANTVDQIVAEHGIISGLVNNAAINPKMESSGNVEFSRLENFPLDQWQKEVDVGLKGAFLCTKYVGTAMVKGGEGGVIVNVCSDLGLIAPDQRLYEQPGLSSDLQPVKPVTYSVIKSGLIGLSRYVSTYWNEHNIRCNALCPGGVENGQPDEFLQKVESRIPMGRMAKKDEYQGTLVWMLSSASSYLNGSVISVDGGRTAW